MATNFPTALLISLLVCCNLVLDAHAQTKKDALDLLNRLFGENYSRRIRPTENQREAVSIYLSFNLLSLVAVDELDQTLTTIARLELEWDDNALSWNMSDAGGIESILVRQDDIWLPDIIVGNSVESQILLGYDELPVRVDAFGKITWDPSAFIATSCAIDVTYYPFDTQVCYIEFETAQSQFLEVAISVDKNFPVSLDDYSENGQWELIDSKAQELDNYNLKTRLRYSLLLKRRPIFYVVNIIMPVLLLSLTGSLVFALPADAGEKMGMSITVLLAFAVYLTIVSNVLPQTSVQTSILALYLTVILGITSLSVVTSVFVLRLHHRADQEPIKPRVYKLIKILEKLTCSTKPKTQEVQTKRKSVAPEAKGDIYDVESEPENAPSAPPIYETLMTWQDVAKILDWFLFLLFTSLIFLVTFATLLVLIVGSELARPKFDTRSRDFL